MQFPATLVQLAESPPPPMASIQTVHQVTKQLKILDWIYPFHAISSNFGSAGRKACPLPSSWTVKFLDWIYPFHAISSNFSSAGRKAPCPSQWPVTRQWMFFRLNLLISCNFQQLWFSWQKSPPPPVARQWNFFRLELSISYQFQQLWFSWQRSPPLSSQTVRYF